MTKDEIKKTLKTCNPTYYNCKICPYKSVEHCVDTMNNDAVNLITEQDNEIERLRTTLRQCNTELNSALESLKSQCREIGELKAKVKQAKIDVLNKVKERAVGLAAIETYHICNLIDELIKEIENADKD